MGGDNRIWQGTALMPLYRKQIRIGRGHAKAVKRAGIEGGWLLIRAIYNDRRRFDTRKRPTIREYRWVP
jgi:hypothetical protein